MNAAGGASRDERRLLSHAGRTHRDATALLRATRLVERLSGYGEVVSLGSYRYDLMYDPDLDFYVVNPSADLDLALDALNAFVRSGEFYAYYFGDWASAPRHPSMPEGTYLGLKKLFRKRKWKVDVWFVRSDRENDREWIERSLTPESRLAILRLKRLREEHGVRLPSYELYRAVLEERITDEDFLLRTSRS